MEKGERAVTSEMEEKIRHSFFKKRESSTVFVGTNDYTNIRFQTLNVREVVSKILGLSVENFQLNDYNRYQYPFFISYGHINVYYHDKDIEFISLKRDQLKFKNNYNKKLDGTWALLYYDKNDKIIGYSQEYFYKAKPHKTTTLDAYIEHCDYSRIEVILLEADNY